MISLKLLFPSPWSTVLDRIDLFHLDGFRGCGLKEHISPQNKQFSLKLKGSSVHCLCLATGFSTLAHFWVVGFCFQYFAMWYEDV